MGFLKNFFVNVFKESAEVRSTSSFDQLSEAELECHLRVSTYGNFKLTDAIRPSYDLKVVPRQGYRHELYHDADTRSTVPVLMGSASHELLFEMFIELLQPLGNVVDVVLESSHDRRATSHQDLYREHIDMPVLTSILYDFEDLLTHDGCAGIAVLNPDAPREVQFDEHKLLVVYGHELTPFERVFESHGVLCDDQMKFITEAEHVHSSCDRYVQQFEALKTALGMDCQY
jgi:hypothetical protein